MDDGREQFVGTEEALTARIIGVFFQVYNELGFGFLESVYCRSLRIGLSDAGLRSEGEVAVPVSFRGQLVGSFRADLVVEEKVILEVKTADAISKAHEAQLTHYLRASSVEVGLVLNFGSSPKFRRIEFLNSRKRMMSLPVPIPPSSL